jgi:fumarate reductase (CoM/CoB) subunit B
MASDTVTARVFRYDPSTDQEPRYETYKVQLEKQMRVLDVLDRINENEERALAYRWFCGVKKCGACGVTVNSRPALSCWEPAQEEMTIEPLINFPIIRDLVVDTTDYDRVVLLLHPLLERHNLPKSFPEKISHDEMKEAYKLMPCLECYLCTAAVPVRALTPNGVDWKEDKGTAALVLFAKAAFDPRDHLDRTALAENSGVKEIPLWPILKDVCPNGINILHDAIMPLKQRFFGSVQHDEQVQSVSKCFVVGDKWCAFVLLTDDIKQRLIANGALRKESFKEIDDAYRYIRADTGSNMRQA